jgi:hypothetical protein
MKKWQIGILALLITTLCGGAFGLAAYTHNQLRDFERRLQIVRFEPNQSPIVVSLPKEMLQRFGNLEERLRKLETSLANANPANVAVIQSPSQNGNSLEARINRIEQHLTPHIELLGQSQNPK